MYLKALNVVGFKSFADKTTVQFHPGVTAIVGPNGCGKSNVLDSIRWVLGEQSAKALRGGQMSDVIFNGSEKRKPLGMAEVSLTFGDCEKELGTGYNEVTITRRLFRDGSSEYEVNKTPCRLRDIHQLFMDTGVGRTAYSIMEQGKIDQILSARPEDRRAVFEEAAGITKFKSQKKEAMRKLEHTEANLLRLEDVVGEVRRQIGSLQRQAAKARRYQEIFGELRDLELKFARRQYARLTRDIAELTERTDSSRETHRVLAAAVEEEDAALGRFREELMNIEGEAARIREALAEARNAGERAVQRQQVNAARVEEFSLLRENARIELAGVDEKIRIQEEQLAALEAQIASAAETRAAAEAAHRAKEEEVREIAARVADKENERDSRRHDLGRMQSALVGQRNQLIALEAQHRNLLLRIEALRSEQDSLSARRGEAEAARAAQEAEVALAGEAVEAARAVVREREAAVEERRAVVAEREAAVAQKREGVSLAQAAVEEK
ncbi:MAG TPA: AAA family ATPase, partial [Candidatus Methylacidiphilales bacterium]